MHEKIYFYYMINLQIKLDILLCINYALLLHAKLQVKLDILICMK